MSTQNKSTEKESDGFAASCPECEWGFGVESPTVGEVVVCPDCNLNLIITALNAEKLSIFLELTEANADDWGQ